MSTILFQWHFYLRVQRKNVPQKENILSRRRFFWLWTFIPPSTKHSFNKDWCNSIVTLVLTVASFVSISNQFHWLRRVNCFDYKRWQNSTFLYQSGEMHRLLTYESLVSILGGEFLRWKQSFQCLVILAFQLQLV